MTPHRAYVTLLYSDSFALTTRVLGASLDMHGAAHPRICMYTEHVSPGVVERLAAERWHMLAVPTVDLPPLLQESQFRYIYSKLAAWNLGRLAGVGRRDRALRHRAGSRCQRPDRRSGGERVAEPRNRDATGGGLEPAPPRVLQQRRSDQCRQ